MTENTKRSKRNRMASFIAEQVGDAIREVGFQNPGYIGVLANARWKIETALRERIAKPFVGNELLRIARPRTSGRRNSK